MFIPTITKDMETKIAKTNTKSTAKVILENLLDVTLDDVLIDLYIKTNDKSSLELAKIYEKQMILAVLDKEKFKSQLHKFYKDTAKYIKKNNLYNEFLLFFHNVYKLKFFKEDAKYSNLNMAYMSLILEQFCYFADYKNRFVGVTSDNKPILIREPYLYLDYPPIANTKDIKEYLTLYNKLGFDINDYNDIVLLSTNYRLIANTLSLIAFLIDEDTIDILAENYAILARGFYMPKGIDFKTDNIDVILMNRRRLLKRNRLIANVNIGFIKRVELIEKFKNDELYLLIKFTLNDNTEFNGYYDIMNNLLWTVFTEGTHPDVINIRKCIEVLVKELYLIKTADLDIDKTHYEEFNYEFIEVLEKEDNNSLQRNPYNRNKEYVGEIRKIDAFTRRLPNGAKASDEAISEAKRFGINLKSNETFVKPFQKNIYKVK